MQIVSRSVQYVVVQDAVSMFDSCSGVCVAQGFEQMISAFRAVSVQCLPR